MDPKSPEEWARLTKAEWEERARSKSRDFFIASHAGWDVAEEWDRQAAADARLILTPIDGHVPKDADVLELGCGVGRLVPYLAPVTGSYTGVDISASHVDEARRRNAKYANARFFENDGLGLPNEARDRAYRLIFAHAVFIHCPLEVIRSLIVASLPALGPRGELRMQLRADVNDLEGIVSFEAAESIHEAAQAVEMTPIEDRHLIDERHYAGACFSYSGARRFLAECADVDVDVIRVDRHHIYARMRNARPA